MAAAETVVAMGAATGAAATGAVATAAVVLAVAAVAAVAAAAAAARAVVRLAAVPGVARGAEVVAIPVLREERGAERAGVAQVVATLVGAVRVVVRAAEALALVGTVAVTVEAGG